MTQNPNNFTALKPANVDWDQQTPISPHYDDYYFSSDDGAEESRHVFLLQNRLEARWTTEPKPNSKQSTFTIAETGFGTGLNFLCSGELWRQCTHSRQYQQLHYISIEKVPLKKADLQTAISRWPQFQWLLAPLLAQYPGIIAGFHRLHFYQYGITLTLVFGDALESLQTLEASVDAWFLDGFSPAKNPDMWLQPLYQSMARLSHEGTSFSTFTCARPVRDGLQQAGFDIEKISGFGLKREMLKGYFKGDQPSQERMSHKLKPWFHYDVTPVETGRAAVIGAGMAGCTVARALANRGWSVDVYEQCQSISSAGSGNPTGITFIKPSVYNNPQNRYYQTAYLNACNTIRTLFEQHQIEEGTHWCLQGVTRLAYNDAERLEQNALLKLGNWHEDLLQPLTREQLEAQYGIDSPYPALILKTGGWLNPQRFCQTLLQHPSIHLKLNNTVTKLDLYQDKWQLGNNCTPYNAVILANAFQSNEYPFSRHLPLRPIRGQVSYVASNNESKQLKQPVTYDGYINPAHDGFHCLGATFTPKNKSADELEEDHLWNSNQLQQALPTLHQRLGMDQAYPQKGRVGFRCQTPDYLPVVGPMPDPDRYLQQYAPLAKGFLRKPFAKAKYLPGLYVSAGHGSRGITSTCLAAEIIASYVSGEPQAIDSEVLKAIHPARFLVRDIIRRKR